jgi:hypothetical protein
MYAKNINNTHLSSPSPFTLLHPLVLSPRQALFYLPSCHILKFILIVQGGVHLLFHILYITQINPFIIYSFSTTLLPYYSAAFSAFCYTIFIHRLTCLLFTLSLPPCSPIIQQFSVHSVILSSYTDECISILFTLCHCLFLSFLLIVPSDRLIDSLLQSFLSL